MTNEQYHGNTSRISKSGLDLIAQCPANYYHKYLRGKHSNMPTKAMELGTLFHTMVLEPANIELEYIVLPDSAPSYPGANVWNAVNPSKESQAAMAFWRQFQSIHGGKRIIDQSDMDTAQHMRDAIMSHPSAKELLASPAAVERTVEFTDTETGAPCKCRPDLEHREGIIVDLKSTEDASPVEFGRSAYKYRYHVQSPFYIDGINTEAGYERMNTFVFIACEKKPPFNVAVYFATNDDLELGRREYRANLATYMLCKASGHWPGYSAKIEPLQIPTWAYRL